jgi:hypothetical protein
MIRSIINVDPGELRVRTVPEEFRSGRAQDCLDVGRTRASKGVSLHPDIELLVWGENALARCLSPSAILQPFSTPTLLTTEAKDEDNQHSLPDVASSCQGAQFFGQRSRAASHQSRPNLKRDSKPGGHALRIVVSTGKFAVVIDIGGYAIVP